MANDNPYAAPAASLDAVPVFEVPAEVLKKIKSGWVAALISGGMTLVLTLLAMSGTALPGVSAWQLIDVAIILALAFGIYKKSRACAVTMFVYFVASKIILLVKTGQASGIVMGIIFAIFFWQGIAGTFAYHQLRKEAAPVPYVT